MNIALVYDRINKFGGAERVLQTLHRIFPQAPLYTSVYSPRGASWANGWDIRPSFLQSFPLAARHHEPYVMLMPYAFESFDFSQYDLVISVTSAEAKGIITRPPTKHLCYLLTPTRYLWSHTNEYRGSKAINCLRSPFLTCLRQWDFLAAQRPDYLIPISRAVAKRAKKYYRREVSPVIYPPVDTAKFAVHPQACSKPQNPYFLIVSRLVPYKHIDTALDAFRWLPQEHLIVVGQGSALNALKRHASGNVTFRTKVDDDELICLYHHAQALIFPQEEDFGIVAVEAQAAGLPVIAYNRGGACETVVPNSTGIRYDKPDAASLLKAISQFKSMSFNRLDIMKHSHTFSVDAFCHHFTRYMEAVC